jgi:glycosyltransferase involved in cell wall biosynthesis
MSSELPVVSVIVPCFNAGPFIAETLESALGQSFKAIEVIVIDDGSTDDTLARIERFRSDPRLKIVQQSHQGAPAALNRGVALAQGEFIGFLDHDDLWANSKVARHLECFAQYPESAATFSWYGLIDDRGERIHVRTPHWRGPVSFGQLLADFVIGSTSSLMMRRSAIVAAGGFDAQFPRCHDFDLVLRVSLGRPMAVRAVPEELTSYRRHAGQMSRDWRAMHRDWNALLEKMRGIAPAETGGAERLARSNVSRYHACLAYEEGGYAEAAGLIRASLRAHPRAFLADWRSWRVVAACCSGALLPTAVHRGLERLAGVRRTEPTSRPAASKQESRP